MLVSLGGSANAIAQFVPLSKTRRLVFNFPSMRVNSCFEENMAPESDHPCPPSSFEANYEKGNLVLTAEEKGEAQMNLRQLTIGKPPRHCMSSSQLSSASELELDIRVVTVRPSSDEDPPFVPVFRSGSCSDIGPKQSMEDEHICIDNLREHLGAAAEFPCPGAFYGVFDGHGGTDAASFVRENILRFIVEDTHFPDCAKKAIKSAFLKADSAFANVGSFDSSSGTTVLTALIRGRTMLIANAGDCRAVLGKRGKAIELSKDHKPDSTSERLRIEELGGVVYDGYLNGDLSVARAIGDWHMKGREGSSSPLTAEPELQEMVLCEEDEFLILGCDGLWDVMSSQCAVTIVRKELMIHNDPERCSRELIREALNRETCDNLTVVVVCFSPDPPPRLEMPKFKKSISVEGISLLQDALDNNM
ncbi:probable protein phosphatase 2C 27 isoform X2 [Rhodamnia argentea]|uniref:protein-serine/threonine phosphatase n=1 Tax=Rhodamnia argentea TaxID=178133 RepID=A0A8B8PYW3_9MYRT|nr:probable protein phosphatase 2C 27 isoform X2 [Rhodamnia argentea]XP_030539466.2 probable protein phosphatase 2C 27 isoform X2 [Rhodamnia argentea]XP_030539467.2 probable protein phosphatase 2C 27 isoform X2 [Rhodamnia argentea]XP_030539468.2 probable protein phosphatase 2C 27 isoform X2 [Rhodamnia argentea]XP_030539469.2 probable protein phosphatase 2C 27 isoform X2 [Rhodamnia argentea]XP_048135767.1 probable protein phosphatase 2C 27 isoform X2 [Rhodamnia argentea]XP_048135768.1 probable